MNKVSIKQAKELRESIGATHVVVYAVMPDGEQCVSTHGGTARQARQAADAGNRLKAALGWPDDLCRSKPVARECRNCVFWEVERGIFCVNGWTGDGRSGDCRLEPRTVRRSADAMCIHFEARE